MEPKISNSTPLKNALNAVQLCNVAMDYDPVLDIGKLMPGWKIVWNGGQVTDPNYAFVAVDATGQNYALTIRGSVVTNGIFNDWDTFVDWALEDLDVALAYWPFANTSMPCVSAGAYVAFTSMLLMQDSLGSDQFLIDYLLANTVGKGKQLIITGHSLGGNMANVYASYYVETLKRKGLPSDNISLFTFAAPASGNSDFADDLDAKLPTAWHYQNTNDAVPNFPVAEGLAATGNLYSPKPAASAITVTFEQQQIKLQKVFQLLGELFLLAGYQQPQNNYVTFTANLDPNYENNTIQDWLNQAGQQHQLFNYAGYFGIKLPSLTRKPVIHAV
ncbi:hypothetical protein GO495_20460 [Chitinophaga oryziterrae]|uniref:Fungal lipase-type domain-containing protein n=1 Tax=Chitinophaga oryziterrae TaxID=1031224 RepID=A0A6N8JES5_9BACT|nr:lipase family protein [Chitinophaga oryziterrae]MVT42981.1 hypothetical protein [Chitinophaga oryziterrae]